MEKLFSAYSVIDNFRFGDKYYENVNIAWFVADRGQTAVPVEQAITDYLQLPENRKLPTEKYIKELFTQTEAEQLKHFLKTRKNIDTHIEEIKLPVSGSVEPRKSMSISEGAGYYPLHRKENYTLAFKVEGFFNIFNADEKVIPDESQTVVSRDLAKAADKFSRDRSDDEM